jgi:hypothetical protein
MRNFELLTVHLDVIYFHLDYKKDKEHVLAGVETYSAIHKINVRYINAKITTKK